MMDHIKNEPAMIVAFVMSVIFTLVALNAVELDEYQLTTIEGMVTIAVDLFLPFVLPLAGGLVIRQQVWPDPKVQRMIQDGAAKEPAQE